MTNMITKTSEKFSANDAATHLGCSVKQLRQLAYLGFIQCVQLNDGTIYYTPDQLEEFRFKYLDSSLVFLRK